MTDHKMKLLTTILAIVAWYACALWPQYFGGQGQLVFVVPLLFIVFRIYSDSRRQFSEYIFFFAVAIFGFSVDLFMERINVIRIGTVDNYWLLSMWFIFAYCLPLYLDLFQNRLLKAGIAGGVLGVLSYGSGSSFGVLHWQIPYWSLAFYFLFWSLYFPLCLHLLLKMRSKRS